MPRIQDSIVRRRLTQQSLTAEARFTMTGAGAIGLFAGWVLVAAASLMLDSSLSPRFLDLPLGAFLAGQGAVLGLVVVGVRVARAGR
jgi:uncharacterized membrane protein